MNILAVEDHLPSLAALRLSLDKWGHRVVAVGSGVEALEALENDPGLQLLLTDWRMPEMDGLALCRKARELTRPYLHIVVMTARNDRSDRITALQAGADAFLDKPLDLQELRSQLLVAERIVGLEKNLNERVKELQRAHAELTHESRLNRALRRESQATQQRLERVLSGLQEAFVLLNSECRYLYVNPPAAEMAGASREDLEGKSLWEMFPDFVGSRFDAALQRALREDEVVRLEEYYPGRGRWYEHRIQPAPGGLLSVFSSDVTEVKQARKTARMTELWLQAIFDQSSGFLAILSPGGRVLAVNQALLAATGLTRDAVLDRPLWEGDWWCEPADRERLQRSVLEASGGRQISHQCHFCGAREKKVMQRSLTPIRDGSGAVIYVLLQGVDVTEQTAVQAELERARDQALLANRMKSEFLANISHEIRTPLSGLRGMTEFLLDSPLEADQKEYAEAIVQCSESLLAVVEDVLDLSRIEAGQLELRKDPFDLPEVLNDTVGIFRYRAGEKGLELGWTVAEGLAGSVVGDRDRIRQVLVNLISNAVKFTDRGCVDVAVTGEPSAVRFAVCDTGCGIPEEAKPRLWQPFSQVDSSPSRRHGGTGLGLSIVRRLVTLMGGQVGFDSRLGQGSTFWFELALPAAPSTPAVDQAPAPPPSLGQRARDIRVLVAEDNPINRRVILLQLQRIGVQAQAVANGREVLEALHEHDYDLVLMDCQMPEMDGYEATRRIRRGEAGAGDVVVVALTAHALKGERRRCMEAGMNDYLAKPTSALDLEGALYRWCIERALRSRR